MSVQPQVNVPAELRRLAVKVEKLSSRGNPEAQVMAQIAIVEKLEELANAVEANPITIG